jgi:hypothetical protein
LALINELLEVGTFERLGKLFSQVHEPPVLTVRIGNHAKASQTTLGGLKL